MDTKNNTISPGTFEPVASPFSANVDVIEMGFLTSEIPVVMLVKDKTDGTGRLEVFRLVNGTWESLMPNNSGPKVNVVDGRSVSLHVDGASQKIYVAYVTADNGNHGLRVLSYDGGTWTTVGQPLPDQLDARGAVKILLHQGVPYVFLQLSKPDNGRLCSVVTLFNDNWLFVGGKAIFEYPEYYLNNGDMCIGGDGVLYVGGDFYNPNAPAANKAHSFLYKLSGFPGASGSEEISWQLVRQYPGGGNSLGSLYYKLVPGQELHVYIVQKPLMDDGTWQRTRSMDFYSEPLTERQKTPDFEPLWDTEEYAPGNISEAEATGFYIRTPEGMDTLYTYNKIHKSSIYDNVILGTAGYSITFDNLNDPSVLLDFTALGVGVIFEENDFLGMAADPDQLPYIYGIKDGAAYVGRHTDNGVN